MLQFYFYKYQSTETENFSENRFIKFRTIYFSGIKNVQAKVTSVDIIFVGVPPSIIISFSTYSCFIFNQIANIMHCHFLQKLMSQTHNDFFIVSFWNKRAFQFFFRRFDCTAHTSLASEILLKTIFSIHFVCRRLNFLDVRTLASSEFDRFYQVSGWRFKIVSPTNDGKQIKYKRGDIEVVRNFSGLVIPRKSVMIIMPALSQRHIRDPNIFRWGYISKKIIKWM